MHNFNKFISLLLIFAVCLSVVILPVEAKAAAELNLEAQSILAGLGIIDDYNGDTSHADANITRAEMAEIALRLRGLGDLSVPYVDTYGDVTEEYWAAEAIQVLSDLGYIDGNTGKIYEPEQLATYEQAVKVILNILGYKTAATSSGAYPNGYISTASKIGLTKDAGGAAGVPLQFKTLVQLLYNSLEINLMTGSLSNGRYTISDNKTILSEYLKVECGYGQITGTPMTRLNGPSNLFDNEVEINGVKFETSINDIEQFIGYNVKYYATMPKDGIAEIKYIGIDMRDGQILTLDAHDITMISKLGTTAATLKYVDSRDKAKTEKISSKASIIYNGKYLPENMTLKQPKHGTVTMLDTNRDGFFDVLNVFSYESYVVDRYIPTTDTVNSKYSGVCIDFSTYDDYELLLNGAPFSKYNLVEWIVLNVAESADKKYARIEISDDEITGYINEISENILVIDGEEYLYDSEAIKPFGPLKIGDKCTFYFDINGIIIAYGEEFASKAEEYGYLCGLASDNVTEEVSVKLFDEKGNFVIAKLNKKVVFNGRSVKAIDFAKSNLITNNGELVRQLVTFILNGDTITHINTAVESDTYDKSKFVLSGKYDVNNPALFWRVNYGIFDRKYSLSSDAVIFKVPNVSVDVESAYYVNNYTMLTDGKTYPMQDNSELLIYDADENNIVDAVVWVGDFVERTDYVDIGSYLFVVDEVSECVKQNGEYARKISGMYLGADIERYIADDVSKPVKVGDLIQFVVNNEQEISSFIVLGNVNDFDGYQMRAVSNGTVVADTILNNRLIVSDTVLVYGDLYGCNIGQRSMLISTDGPDNAMVYPLFTNTQVYAYSRSHKTFRKAAYEEIYADRQCTRDIILRLYRYQTREVIIFED